MGYFPVMYNSRVVIYNRRGFIRFATGVVVMGGDSCSKGREFKSWHHILDGHLFTYIFVVKLVMCLKRQK